jgi:hypothetical protein
MTWPRFVRAFATMLATGCANANAPRTESALYVKYTIAQCLAKAYPDAIVGGDAKSALGGYLEHGHLEADAYAAATTLAERTVARKYSDLEGEGLRVAKCLDLFESADLAELVGRYVKR